MKISRKEKNLPQSTKTFLRFFISIFHFRFFLSFHYRDHGVDVNIKNFSLFIHFSHFFCIRWWARQGRRTSENLEAYKMLSFILVFMFNEFYFYFFSFSCALVLRWRREKRIPVIFGDNNCFISTTMSWSSCGMKKFLGWLEK